SYSFAQSSTASSGSARLELPPTHPPLSGVSAATQSGPGELSGENKPEWQVPAGWKEVSSGPMLAAKFIVAGPDEAQAVVNVSVAGGEGGGLLANVNRWRNQLGLAPVAES